MAKRSGCRPSQLLELTGMPAYLLDCTAAETLAARERVPHGSLGLSQIVGRHTTMLRREPSSVYR